MSQRRSGYAKTSMDRTTAGLLLAVSIIAMCSACTAPPTGGSSSQLLSASAQPPSSGPAIVRFDGTYQFVSATPVAGTVLTGTQRMVTCPDCVLGTLTIVNGHASYIRAYGAGYHFHGAVASGGQLLTRAEASTSGGSNEIVTHGAVDETGTIHARQVGATCSYDVIWAESAPITAPHPIDTARRRGSPR